MSDNIRIEGYFQKNLGDDLFLKVIAESFPSKKFEIIVQKKEFAEPFLGLKNVTIKKHNYISSKVEKLYRKLFKKQLFFKIKKGQDLIELGGSIFIINDNNHLYNYNRRLFNQKRAGSYKVIGSNFGPYTQSNQVEDYKMFFNNIDFISFRDQYSQELFSELENVFYAPDVVFNLNKTSIKANNYKKKYIVVSPIDFTLKGLEDGQKIVRDEQDLYENKIIEMFLFYIKQGYEMVLLPFSDEQNDGAISKRIYNAIPSEYQAKVNIENYKKLDKTLEILMGSEKIITSRYHGMILGWLFNKETFVISYSKKIENVILSLGLEQKTLSLNDFISLNNDDYNSFFYKIDDEILKGIIREASNNFRRMN